MVAKSLPQTLRFPILEESKRFCIKLKINFNKKLNYWLYLGDQQVKFIFQTFQTTIVASYAIFIGCKTLFIDLIG